MTRPWTPAGLGLLLAATAAVYLPAVDGQFVFDDLAILGDPLVIDPLGQPLSAWLTSARPVLTATYALNHGAVGLDPRGWHLTNLLVHLGAVLLAWRVARRLLSRAGMASPEGPALLASALFALHPLQTESVSYVAQRAESLASALYLAALLLLLARDEASARRRRVGLLAGAAGLQALGLLVKPIVATLPAAWLLAAALLPPPGEEALAPARRLASRLRAAAPLLVLSAAAAAWGLASAAGSPHAGFDVPGLPAARYLATQLRAIPVYVRLLAWPTGQCADWDFPASAGLFAPATLAGAALLAAGVAGAHWLWRRADRLAGDAAAAARLAGFGPLFFLLVLSPSSSLIPLRDPLAEHRVYLASLGLFVAAAAAGAAAVRRLAATRAPAVGGALAAALLVAASAATAARNRVWTGPLALYQDAVRGAPSKARVHSNLGNALAGANRRSEALASFLRARELAADGTVDAATLAYDIVVTLLAIGRADDAREEVRGLLGASPRDPMALALLANVEFVSGRLEEAERAAVAALEQDPAQLLALKLLGIARARRGDVEGALGPLRAAAALHAVDPTVFVELGDAEERAGELEAACRAYARAAGLPLNPVSSRRARAALARLPCR